MGFAGRWRLGPARDDDNARARGLPQVGCLFYFIARLLKMDSTTWVSRPRWAASRARGDCTAAMACKSKCPPSGAPSSRILSFRLLGRLEGQY